MSTTSANPTSTLNKLRLLSLATMLEDMDGVLPFDMGQNETCLINYTRLLWPQEVPTLRSREAAQALGLTDRQREMLFFMYNGNGYPTNEPWSTFTREQAVNTLHHLATTEEVDWHAPDYRAVERMKSEG